MAAKLDAFDPVNSNATPPTAIDLFSGAGGMTQGLKEAGFKVVAGIEIDALAAETYRLNHPEVKLIEADIRDVEPSVFGAARLDPEHRIDLLAGCPPCQGFSTLRTRHLGTSVDDPRNVLVREFVRFARALQPRLIMLENVPGLANHRHMAYLRRHLRTLGYRTRIRIVDAADFGVPQRRRRLLLLGAMAAWPQMAIPHLNRQTVREAIAGLEDPATSKDPLHNHGEKRTEVVAARLAEVPRDGGSRASLGRQLPCHMRLNGFHDVYGRMAWDTVAPTITSGCVNPSKGRFLHPLQDRAITLREAALLQAFPPRYHFSLRRGKYAAATMIGNALPPRLVRAQGEVLVQMLRRNFDVSPV